jgi:hypothetical protein
MTQTLRPQFESSYQGSATYWVAGKQYELRAFARDDGHWTNWPETRAQVGTIRFKHYPDFGDFPPAEVCALFPGYTPARYIGHPLVIEYQTGFAPHVRINASGAVEMVGSRDIASDREAVS